MKDERFCNAVCPLTRAIGKIGNKWKPVIINVMQTKTLRFGQIAAFIPIITRKVLTEQLHELVEDGILTRTSYKELPPRVEYSVTDMGRALLPILKNIADWNNVFDPIPGMMQE